MLIQRLRQFAVVAEEGSIIGAATRLRVAQPSLSRQMHRLEAEVGATLFERERRGVRLTSSGEAIVEGTRDILARLELLVQRTQEAHLGTTGAVHLGVARMALDSAPVARAIAHVRERLPGVRLDVAEVGSPDQARALRARELDLAIGLTDAEGDALVQREVLFDVRMDSALLGTSHPLALRGKVSVTELREYRFLTVRTPLFSGYPELSVALAAAGITLLEEHETVDGIYTLIAAGHGWTMGSSQVHAPPPPGTTLVAIDGLSFMQPVSLRWRGRDRSRVLSNVARLLREGSRGAAESGRQTPATGVPLLPAPTRAMRRLELSQLEAVVAAVEEGSLSAAAARLHLTQSGVSRRVHAVEEAVGCRLIERAMHGVVATNAGETLRDEAREVLRITGGVLARARQAARGVAGECRIGTLPPELTGAIQVAALRRVFEENPQVRIEVVDMLPERQVRALLERRIDIGISVTFPGMEQHPSLSTVVLMDDVLDGVMLAEGHPLASRTWLTAEDLANEPFMFIKRSRAPRAYDAFMGALGSIGLSPTGVATHSGPRAIWRALRAARGWTLATRSQRARPPAGLVSVPLEGLAMPCSVALLWRRDESDVTVRRVLEVFRTTRNPEMAVVVATVRARPALT